MATSTYGTPYVQGSDLVSAYPTVSSNLATRVDEVSYKGNGLNAQTGTTYTLVAGDAGKTITLSNASPIAVTLPQDSTADLPDGAVVSFYNLGAGTVTISQGTGATLQGGSITLAQYEVARVIKLSANTYGRLDATSKIPQVLSAAKTDQFSTTSTTFVDVTGLSVTITPSSTSSQILIFADVKLGNAANVGAFIRLMRGATAIYIGDAAGNRTRATYATADDPSINWVYQGMGIFLDAPATTSATTYKVQLMSEASPNTGIVYVNSSGEDLNSADFARTASSITVMEIK